MKFSTLLKYSLIALASTSLAHADWVFEQKTETAAGPGKSMMKIKGDKVLTELEAGPVGKMTIIIDTKSGDSITLMHAQKMVMKQSGAAMKAMTEQMAKANPNGMKPVDTGEKEKIGAYDCSIYTMEIAGAKTKMWVANNYPNAAKVMEAQNKLAATMPGGKDMMIKGITVKTVAEAGGQKVTSELVSAKEVAVPDSDFAVPKDYKEMTMPVMPTVPKAE